MRNTIAESRRHMYRLLRSLKNAECSPTGGFFAYDSLRSIAVFLKKSIRCLVRRSSYHRPFSATRRIEGDPMGRPYAAASAALPPFLHPHLGRHRSGIADVLVVMHLVAAGEMVEIPGEDRVAVEIQEPSFFGQEVSKILIPVHLGDLAERLAFGVVRRRSSRSTLCSLMCKSRRSAMRNASLMALCKSGRWYLRSRWSGS